MGFGDIWELVAVCGYCVTAGALEGVADRIECEAAIGRPPSNPSITKGDPSSDSGTVVYIRPQGWKLSFGNLDSDYPSLLLNTINASSAFKKYRIIIKSCLPLLSS